jgi:hypothetical protein
MIHLDHPCGLRVQGRYSFLMALSSNPVPSTWMWNHSLAALPPPNPSSMRHVHPRIWNKKEYHSVSVQRGQILFFNERVPHYGPRNPHRRFHRRMLFVQVFDLDYPITSAIDNEAFQFYEWQYVEQAWGEESREYALALVRHREDDAVGRFEDPRMAWRVLRKHGLLEAYYGPDRRRWPEELGKMGL